MMSVDEAVTLTTQVHHHLRPATGLLVDFVGEHLQLLLREAATTGNVQAFESLTRGYVVRLRQFRVQTVHIKLTLTGTEIVGQALFGILHLQTPLLGCITFGTCRLHVLTIVSLVQIDVHLAGISPATRIFTIITMGVIVVGFTRYKAC